MTMPEREGGHFTSNCGFVQAESCGNLSSGAAGAGGTGCVGHRAETNGILALLVVKDAEVASIRVPLILALLLVASTTFAGEDLDLSPLKKWILRQKEVRTVQANFTQTRSFRALKDPLTSPGRIYFSAPRFFRWEVGDPPKTVVLRKGDIAYLIQPTKQRAERFSAAELGRPGGANPLPMMNFPLADSFEDFNRQFEAQAISVEGTRCHVELQPRDVQSQKLLDFLKLDFDTATGYLIAFEVRTRDGSMMRNDFSNVRFNEKVDPRLFDYDLTGYNVVDGKQ